MGIVHDFDKCKYNLPSVRNGLMKLAPRWNPSHYGVSKEGSGTFSSIVDRVKGGVDLAVKNKDLINTVGTVAGTVSKILEAVKAAQ